MYGLAVTELTAVGSVTEIDSTGGSVTETDPAGGL